MHWIWWVIIAVAVVLFIVMFATMQPALWFKAWVSGTYIRMTKLWGMRMRKINTQLIVTTYIKARKSGLKIGIEELETHYMARGNVEKVVDALIAAHSANIPLDNKTAMAIDLAGRDVKDAIKTCITPRVIESGEVSAMAQDGIEIKVKVKVTLRANIKRFIGTSMEETIIARVGEGIVTTIGSAKTHKQVIENPDIISGIIYEKLQKKINDTAFDVVSVDIADITMGRNIMADLQIEEAMAKTYIANAEAEKRKAEAVAMEQEMKALTQQMKAQLVEAESALPKAIAEAFMRGNISVNEYYKLQNLISDTDMRNSIAGIEAPKKKRKGED